MSVKPIHISDIDSRLRSLYERGVDAARQKNYKYAFDMFRTVLKAEPAFWEGRQELRKAQFARLNIKDKINPLRQIIATFASSYHIFILGNIKFSSGKIEEALDIAEFAMSFDPSLLTTINFLAQCFAALEYNELLVDTLELAEKYHPNNIAVLTWLGDAYANVGQGHGTLRCQQRIVELQPNNQDAIGRLKSAAALAAMEEGKWEKANSYRDLIKDKDLQVALEQESRTSGRDEDAVNNLIKRALTDIDKGDTVILRKKIADLYMQIFDYDSALEHYNKVIEIAGTVESNIHLSISKAMSLRFDQAISEWEEYAKENIDNEAEAKKQIATLNEQKMSLNFERSQERVKLFPGNPAFRYEFGEACFENKMFDEALSQFQQAQKNPKYKLEAIVFMARCFGEKKQYDLAISQYKMALEEMPVMNTKKKNTLYYMGVAYEGVGNTEEAGSCFKQIYQLDVNFRDISDKINALYN